MAAEDAVGIKARSVLWYLTFAGFAMNYMIRININIAIVDMISGEFKGTKSVMSECVSIVNSTNETFYQVAEEAVDAPKYISFERRFLDFIGVCFDSACHENYLLCRQSYFRWNTSETASSGIRRLKMKCSERSLRSTGRLSCRAECWQHATVRNGSSGSPTSSDASRACSCQSPLISTFML